MSSATIPKATLADLAQHDGKAELIAGRIEPLMAPGHRPSRVASRIFRSLDDYAESTGRGFAYTDNLGYAVDELSSGRESFSPDASYSLGPAPENEMGFIHGAPILAIEVRSENDYSLAADAKMAEKRADYFEAGTRIVWDVDPVANMIRAYRAESPDHPVVFVPGQIADAEPVLPGWTLSVESVFKP
jgi:Uma2 family endonuclease